MKARLLYILVVIFISCFSLKLSAQEVIQDEVFTTWITNSDKQQFKYFVLLNPNMPCSACYTRQLKAIVSDKLYNDVCVITYEGLQASLRSIDTQNKLEALIKPKHLFNNLGYLRYRNALLKFENGELTLLLKLKPQNAAQLKSLIQ